MTSFPQTAQVKKLQQEHPDYTKYKDAWRQIGLLYEGGTALKHEVGAFLVQNTKELPEVYGTRQRRFSYTNLLGNVIGWYISALFKQNPQVTKRTVGVEGDAALEIPQDAEDFCNAFEGDCNHAGLSLNDFMHDAAETALLYKTAWVVLDLPLPDGDQPITQLQQRQAGLLNPYLVLYDPLKVINWETDDYGNLEWAIIHIRVFDQEFLEDAKITDRWYYFDRQQAALYERDLKADQANATASGEEYATLCPGYPRPHAQADQNVVPIHRVLFPQGLWLANRVLLPLINHLNLDNAFDFGLYQSNLPQLVITDGNTGTYEEPVTISAVGYHHLPFGATMQFLEPAGVAFDSSADRIANLEERIYKACYLMDQARTNKSTPTAQSGVSKQQDKTPSRDALSGLGGVLQASMQAIYTDVLAIANFANVEPDIRGFDFTDKATGEDMDLLEKATIIPVSSPTFEREIAKLNVTLTLPDINPETRDAIFEEIDSLPTPSEVQAAAEEQQRSDTIAQFNAGITASPVPNN
ncbi:MAG: hypothetical protein NVS9B4_00630 [Candidatus Acidiferrum sp.]